MAKIWKTVIQRFLGDVVDGFLVIQFSREKSISEVLDKGFRKAIIIEKILQEIYFIFQRDSCRGDIICPME